MFRVVLAVVTALLAAGTAVSAGGGVVDVTSPQFGADPAGAADSTAAINNAIAAAGSGGGVVFPAGTYKVTDSLNVVGLQGLRIAGAAGNSHSSGAVLSWHGGANTPLWNISGSRDCLFENLTVSAAAPLSVAYHLETRSGLTITHNLFRHCYVQGVSGRIKTGFEMQVGSGGDNNNDFHSFEDCDVANFTQQAWLINHAQSVCHRMIQCKATQGPGSTTTSYGVNCQAGSFNWEGGFVGRVGVAFGYNKAGYPKRIADVSIEQTGRILTGPYQTAPQQVILEGVRFPAESLAADGHMIVWGTTGTLICLGCRFGGSGTARPKILAVSRAPYVARVIVRGCHFAGAGSSAAAPLVWGTGPRPHSTFEGNVYSDATGHGVANPNWD